jgi:hypothetical protein
VKQTEGAHVRGFNDIAPESEIPWQDVRQALPHGFHLRDLTTGRSRNLHNRHCQCNTGCFDGCSHGGSMFNWHRPCSYHALQRLHACRINPHLLDATMQPTLSSRLIVNASFGLDR